MHKHVVVLLGVLLALVLPTTALAIDHVTLSLTPATPAPTTGGGATTPKPPAKPPAKKKKAKKKKHYLLSSFARSLGPAGWSLRITDSTGDVAGTSTDMFLARYSSTSGRVEQRLDLSALPANALTWSGTSGKLDVGSQLGGGIVVNLTLAPAAGATPTPTAAPAGCSGGTFVSIPVQATGNVTLPTGSAFFGTPSYTSFAGTITYNTAGSASCSGAPTDAIRSAPCLHGPSVLVTDKAQQTYYVAWDGSHGEWIAVWDPGADASQPGLPDWSHAVTVSLTESPFRVATVNGLYTMTLNRLPGTPIVIPSDDAMSFNPDESEPTAAAATPCGQTTMQPAQFGGAWDSIKVAWAGWEPRIMGQTTSTSNIVSLITKS